MQLEGKPVRFENRKAVALLAFLAVTRQTHSRDRLAALLWPDSDAALAALRTTLWELRRKLGDDNFVISRQDLSLNLDDDIWCDTSEYAMNLRSAAEPGIELSQRIETLQHTVELYVGDFLSGFSLKDSQEFDDWLMAQTAYYQRLQSRALLELSMLYPQVGDVYAAIQTAERLRAMDRLAQEPVEALLSFYALSGQRQAVQHLYDDYTAFLKQEIGVAPDSSLTSLFQKLISSPAAAPESRTARPVTGVIAAGSITAVIYRTPETVMGRPRKLFGRDDLVAKLLDLLCSGERILLTGMGGIGKTSIAAALSAAFIRAQNQPVIWLETGFQRSNEIFVALARAFNQQSSILAKPDPSAIMELLAMQQGLVVLDNCWNASALFEVMNAIPAHLPVLLTSRQHIPIEGEVIDVTLLDTEHAHQLLAYHARRDFADDAELTALMKMIGYHPYAIEIAGKQLKAQPRLSPRELRSRYLRGTDEIAVAGGYSSEERRSIAHVIATSVETVSPDARTILTLMGSLASSHASLELIALVLDMPVDKLEPALSELEQSSLIEVDRDGSSGIQVCRIHDLIYSYSRDLFKASRMDHHALVRGVREYVRLHSHNIMAVELDYTNILGAVRAATSMGDVHSVIEILRAMMVDGYFDARGYTPELLDHLDDAIRFADQLPDEQEALHYLLSKRINVFQMQGKLNEAFQENLIALATAPNVQRRALLAMTLGTIAHRLKREGEYQLYLNEAELVARQHNIHDVLSRITEYRAYIAYGQGDFHQACLFFEEAMHIAEGLDKPDRHFYTLYNLAVTEIDLSNCEQAEQRIERAYQIALEQQNDIWKAMCYSSLGRCTHTQGNRDETFRLMMQALEIYERARNLPLARWVRGFLVTEGYASDV